MFNNTLAFVDLSDDLSTGQGITLVGVDGSQVSRVLFESSKGMVQLLAGLNAYSQSRSEHSKSVVWQRASCDQVASTDYVPCTFPDDCEFDVKTQMPVVVEQIRGQTLAWLEPLRANLEKNGGSLNVKELDPIYTHTETKQQGPTAALSMMAALAITLATAGSMGGVGSTLATQMGLTTSTATGAVSLTTAGSIVQGMTAATLTSLCVSAGNSVLNNTHNPTKAFQDFLSDKTWVGALKAGSIGGATAGLGYVFGVPQDAATLGDRALKGVVNTVATTGVYGVFGDSPEDALKAGIRTGAVAVVQGTLAHKIGDLKADEVVDPATGLALHGLTGGLGGVILAGTDGMLPGAVGAMVGEGVAEYRDDATLGKFMGAVSGAVIDLAQGGDGTKGLAVATLTASTAVEENYLRHRTSCAVPNADEEAEAEPEEEYHFRPNSPRTTYALEEMERFELAQEQCTAIQRETRRQAGITKKSVFDSAYEFKQRELADRFMAKDAADLTPYEARVLHDYRTGASIGLALEVTPLALPAVGRAVTRVVVSTKGVVNAAGKLKYSAVKRAMGKGSVERFRATHFEKVKWVDEKAGMNPSARAYNDSVMGARSNASTHYSQAPSLKYMSKSGQAKTVRFDGLDGKVLIDRKMAVVTTDKTRNQAIRQSEALNQNGLQGRWEVPDATQKARASRMLDELNISNIKVEIVHVPKS